MSTHVVGLRDPQNEHHQKMVAAARALAEAGVCDMPKDLESYFGTNDAYEAAHNPEEVLTVDLKRTLCTEEFNEECREGFTVEVAKLPKAVTHVRFYNSY